MSQKNTTAPSVVKVVSDKREEELLSYMSSLHGKMLTILQEVGVEPKFPKEFAACKGEDYKNMHHQMRILIEAKDKAKWDTYVSSLEAGIMGVINTHMDAAHAKKARYDAIPADAREFLAPFPNTIKIPVSEFVPHFPKGKTLEQVVAEMTKLFSGKVGKGKDDAFFLTLAYAPKKAEKVGDSEEAAPKSAEQPTVEATTAAAAE